MIRFIDRERELKYLETEYRKAGLKFVVIYGRRRVGKTELIKKFIASKPNVYFLADKRGIDKNIERFRVLVEEAFALPPLRCYTFEDIFKEIARLERKVVICIDEFSYLIETDPAIVSVFQLIVDEILKNKNFFLILSGSYVSLMETEVLSYRSPLYGRRTGQIEVKGIPLNYLRAFLPKYSTEQLIEAYAILDTIPGYLKFFDSKLSLLKNLQNTLLNTEHLLYLEPEILLKEELKEPTNYFNILSAIATGNSKLTDIANKSGIPFKDLPRYIKILINLGFVEKACPVTEKEKSKKTIYKLSDNLFRFWFRFVLPNKSYIEKGELKPVLSEIERDFNSFVSFAFENISRAFIEELKVKGCIFSFTKLGTWWGKYREKGERKTAEIDIVALNEDTKQILFAECKWQDNVDAEKVLAELKEKSKHVQWHNEKREEYYMIFAKSFKKKIKEPRLFLYDLKGLESIFKGSHQTQRSPHGLASRGRAHRKSAYRG